jgi:polyisoprenyl-teichoic acid--peptidoglycan teichoic acid transferase
LWTARAVRDTTAARPLRYNRQADSAVTTPYLEPTERIPQVPEDIAGERVQEPRRGPNLLGFVGRLLLVVVMVCAALAAAALLLTPTRETVLILGSDARPDEIRLGQTGRTDTLLLLVADRAMPRLAMVSVPRDLWVTIPGYGEERSNVAFESGGSQTAKQTVSNTLGQRVDRYAVIGLQGVREMVDAVGGIDVTVAQAIHDDSYPTDDYGYQTVDIPAGRQHLDGDTALKYARTRHQDSDFGRIARQQQVLAGLRTALLNPVNWPRIPAVAAVATQSIKTDLSPLDAIAVGAAMLRAPGDPDRLVVDTSLVTPVVGEGGAYLLVPKPELKPTVARFIGGASVASIEVLNGAGIAGLARATADNLAQRGFVVANVGDASRPQNQTTIQVKPGARAAGEQVASALNLPTSHVSEGITSGEADVQLILGADMR